MEANRPVLVRESDVYKLTRRGSAELSEQGTALPAEELRLLILIDGQSSVAQLSKVSGVAADALMSMLRSFINRRFIEPADEPSGPDFLNSTLPFTISDEAAAEAEAKADAAHSFLEQNGYYVRLVRRAKPRAGAARTDKPSILLVEDDAQLADLLRRYLKYHGWPVAVAADRAGIVASLRGTPPDLILLDVVLPDVDGFDVLSKMRQHHLLKDVPVIMTTGKATRAAVLKGLALGANGYITKPFELDSVAKAVSAVLGVPLAGGASLKP